jgi:hypothetical protein
MKCDPRYEPGKPKSTAGVRACLLVRGSSRSPSHPRSLANWDRTGGCTVLWPKPEPDHTASGASVAIRCCEPCGPAEADVAWPPASGWAGLGSSMNHR